MVRVFDNLRKVFRGELGWYGVFIIKCEFLFFIRRWRGIGWGVRFFRLFLFRVKCLVF